MELYLTTKSKKARITGTAYKSTDGVSSVLDLSSGVTSYQLVLKKPDGTTATLTTSYLTDGTNGKWKYDTTTEYFLSNPGWWEAETVANLSDGKVLPSSETVRFFIKQTLLG